MTIPGVRPEEGFRVLKSETLFEGKVVSVSREQIVFPNGFETVHERLLLPRAVAIVPILERADGERDVVLVDQLRSSVRGYMLEIPAGIVEPGEDSADCALRELEEETGYVAKRWRHLATLCPIPGTSPHLMDYFLAEDLAPGHQNLEDGECLSVKCVPMRDLIESMLSGAGASGPARVVDTKTHLGILHASMVLSANGESS